MRTQGFPLLLLALALPVAADPVIWKCEDLQKLKEYSSIQCAPDAQVYVPPSTNAGGVAADPAHDRRYIEFLNRHSIKDGAPNAAQSKPAAAPAEEPRREGRNLNRFKTYNIQR